MRLLILFFLVVLAGICRAETYRCGNTYSDSPCKGGRVVDTTPPIVNHSSANRSTSTVYLCKGSSGGSFWTSQHCREHGATIDRMETVPANLSWETQLAMAKAQRDNAAALQQQPEQSSQMQGVAGGGQPDKRTDCGWLEARIKQLDSMARAGGTPQHLDWIAARRKEARDRQFRIRC